MSQIIFRIHPAIGIARVGNSEEFYIGPESMAGMPIPGEEISGGLPIQPNTEATTITSADLRDNEGKLKRQAARFRIYQYAFDSDEEQYPNGQGQEVQIGSEIDGSKVKDIIWTVHLANKKANSWPVIGEEKFRTTETKDLPLRNDPFLSARDPADPNRLKHLVIDPGPRAIQASTQSVVQFDRSTAPTVVHSNDPDGRIFQLGDAI